MQCIFCEKHPCECKSTLLEDIKASPVLPGAMVMFATAGSSGRHESHLGVGEISLHLHKPGQTPPWIDLGNIFYSSPTLEQYERCENGSQFSEERKAFGDHKRRLSLKQAHYIQSKICSFLMEEFKGVIPPDDEIDDLMKQAK